MDDKEVLEQEEEFNLDDIIKEFSEHPDEDKPTEEQADAPASEEAPVEECEITIPKEFDKVMTSYNEIQKQQGLDLSKYAKKSAKRYTYKVTNYPEYNGTVYANVIVYRDKVIAGDICSADARGFIHTLPMPK